MTRYSRGKTKRQEGNVNRYTVRTATGRIIITAAQSATAAKAQIEKRGHAVDTVTRTR